MKLYICLISFFQMLPSVGSGVSNTIGISLNRVGCCMMYLNGSSPRWPLPRSSCLQQDAGCNPLVEMVTIATGYLKGKAENKVDMTQAYPGNSARRKRRCGSRDQEREANKDARRGDKTTLKDSEHFVLPQLGRSWLVGIDRLKVPFTSKATGALCSSISIL